MTPREIIVSRPLYDVFPDDTCSPETLLMTAPMKTLSAILRLHGEAERRIQREVLSADKDFACRLWINQWVRERTGWPESIIVRGTEARTIEHLAVERERLKLSQVF